MEKYCDLFFFFFSSCCVSYFYLLIYFQSSFQQVFLGNMFQKFPFFTDLQKNVHSDKEILNDIIVLVHEWC